MTARDEPPPIAPDLASDLRRVAHDWITLWHSELAAMAVDRELQENFHTGLKLWANAAGAMVNAMPKAWPDAGIPPGPHAAPRPAPAAAAPDARDAEIERLARIVAELERRLGELESREP